MKRWTVAFPLLVILVTWVTSAARAEDRLHVDIHGGSGRAYQVAVQRFTASGPAGELREEFHRELTAALEFSGVMNLVDPRAFLGPRETEGYDRTTLACENWRGIGADALVQGVLELEGQTIRARFRAWDTVRCRLQGDPMWMARSRSDLGLLARSVADEIVGRFTGRRGVAATQIAFVSNRTGSKEVYVMEANGAKKRPVTQNRSINLFPSWSPKGNALVYTSYRSGRPDLWMVVRGPRQGRRLLANGLDKYRGVWAPAGDRLAVVMDASGNTDLYTVDAEGRGAQRVTSNRAIETSPSWSPDGTKLAFVSDRSGSPQIYVKDLRTGDERRITFQGPYNASPAWSPTGEWIAFAAQAGANFDLYLIDPESGFTTALVVHPRSDEDPAWSPDGRKLVFTSSRLGRKEVYRVDVDGRNLIRLTEGFGECSNPTWSRWFD